MSTDTLTIPRKSGLPREVFKWLQSLDLTFPVHNVRRDFSNGFLVGEIFSCYYPTEIEMHSYTNGTSLQTKLGNWSLMKRFFNRNEFDIPKEVIDGTIHCKPGAAELLVVFIYSILTKRPVRGWDWRGETDFTDITYQLMLPMHARPTATRAIKNNTKITENITEPNMITNKEKVSTMGFVEDSSLTKIVECPSASKRILEFLEKDGDFSPKIFEYNGFGEACYFSEETEVKIVFYLLYLHVILIRYGFESFVSNILYNRCFF